MLKALQFWPLPISPASSYIISSVATTLVSAWKLLTSLSIPTLN